ncbi:FixH family protein [Bacillus sp. ISL-40]|uniref:FixH family protein n=1 Tax=unclassified Bacillus (in: firmicutes) TaxID=185979 RepID=UPI001BEBA4AA|nr:MULTISPECIES: FixH family protein [unclassified Bacillus (in: firmicutes)]MBT2699271.1 FixH family protein [Bacillus sp. ISL-40]MBT2723461.1 FixH family protein [Bacillus sp. ISL-46]MBT2739869.1 FixH family protein [Bacillus sp. ISL-77]
MKKLFVFLVTVLCLSIVISCSNKKEQADNLPQMVEVELSINPDPGKMNQPITFEAKVTQGNDQVKDAEVIFEIWRSKDDKHEKVEIKHAEKGIYRLERSFSQEGTYYIISHVTARDMHNMPKKEFTIGTPSAPEDPNTKNSMDGMKMKDESH